MKKTVSIIAISCLALLAGCSSDKEAESTAAPAAQPSTQQAVPAPAAAPATNQHANHPTMPGHTPSQATPVNQHQGKVVSVTHAAGYTYLEVEIDGKNTWVAASPVNVKTGDTVGWSGGAPMSNFTSKSLRKTFDMIIFTDQVSVIK